MDSKEALKQYVMSFLGVPYRWGGDDPMSGFDCSGLILEILRSQGLWGKDDTTAQGLFMHFVKLGPTAYTREPEFGSILFFGKGPDQITHTAFALSPFQMVEAGGGGSTTVNQKAAEEQNAFIRIRPIRADLKGAFNPFYPWRSK